MDPVDQVLESLKLHSSVFSRLELGAGWGFSKDRLEGAPFHIVLQGEAWVGAPDGGELTRLGCGDMAIMTCGQPHLLLSAPNAEAIPWKSAVADLGIHEWKPGQRIKPSVLRVGPKETPCAKLISGIFEFADRRRNPLMSALPDLLTLRSSDKVAPDRLSVVSALMNREIEEGGLGTGMVAGRLADYLFIQAVREHLVGNVGELAGWLRGLRDPVIGKALSLIHARPAHDWTVESLAGALNMSRSQFADRFRRFVGRGPIEYLTEWRMFEATGHLTDSHQSLKEIASRSGYRSVAAFGRAFKRWSGASSASVRNASRATVRAD